ncbi:MAG: two-component system activity regulator YycH [Sporosarcina sp.]
MGLKYIESIKSIVLTLLVALSIVLTFSIWTYTPRYETIAPLSPVDMAIADKKTIPEIIKPYKTVFNIDDVLRGTTDPTDIDGFIEELSKWKISNIAPVNSNFDTKNLNTLLRKKNQFTLYFHGEVPLNLYDNVLNIEGSIPTVPEVSFDRIIIDWNTNTVEMDIYFVSRANKKLYSATVKPEDQRSFQHSIVTEGRGLAKYIEVNPGGSIYIAVPSEPVETIKYTFIEDVIPPNKFRDVLFSDPNAVRSNKVGTNTEELGDNHARMKIDKYNKKFDYDYPTAAIHELAIPSELLENTINFVNEHGGWTDEFRYTYMNPASRIVRFRLFLEGLPVYTDSSSSTEIVEQWGDKRIFSYKRPYYRIDWSTYYNKTTETLISGIEVAEKLKELDKLDLDTVDEIAPGYFMKRNIEKGNIIMEPAWFYLVKGNNSDNWHRFSPVSSGGELLGLE